MRYVALAIGRLGGHQNRKSDGMPGVLSLWWDMSRFLGIMEGVRLMTNYFFKKMGNAKGKALGKLNKKFKAEGLSYSK